MPEWENHINTILNDYREDFEQIIKLLEKSDIITSKPIILDNIYIFSRVEDKEKRIFLLQQNMTILFLPRYFRVNKKHLFLFTNPA